MKKVITMMAVVMAFSAVPAYAANTASYEEMKAIKKAQREKREAEKNNPAAKPETKWSKFWKNEGERSGLAQTGGGAGTFFRSLNPAPFFKSQEEQYNARKSAAGK